MRQIQSDIVLFVVLFWLAKIILWPLWALVAGAMFDKQAKLEKKAKKEERKKQKELEKEINELTSYCMHDVRMTFKVFEQDVVLIPFVDILSLRA